MSLTSHLSSPASPIGQFIKQSFAHTANLTKVANQQPRKANTILPVQPDSPYPYALIGTSIDYRIRYAFAITPYQRLVAWKGATKLAFKPLESDDEVPVDWDELEGMLIPFAVLTGVAQGPYPLKFLRTFFDDLHALLNRIQPVGRLIEPDAERELARYCYVLSLFEQVYRSKSYILGPLMVPDTKRSMEELLAIPQETWLDDLSAMFALFYERYNHLLAQPHQLNPTFAGSGDVGGADADMIVDGCLIDIKASVSPKLEPEHLRQLVGYLLLDYDDRYNINSVGIYMARQGLLFTWSVPEFLRQLTGDGNITLVSLRQEFCKICKDMRKW